MAKGEREVESYLHDEFKKLNGTTRKWTSPGRAGVPDRICILPGNHIIFVEVKQFDGKLSVRQTREINELKSYGCDVFVVYGMTGVDELIEKVKKRYVFA